MLKRERERELLFVANWGGTKRQAMFSDALLVRVVEQCVCLGEKVPIITIEGQWLKGVGMGG